MMSPHLDKSIGDDGQELTLLLVEDERKLARAVEKLLLRNGFLVQLAFDADAAKAIILSRTIHLVILDINLGARSGLDLLADLRSEQRTVPVLILSARDGVGDRVKGLQVGADDYLVKPFDSSELLARIQSILRRTGTLKTSVLTAGDLKMDLVRRRVTRNDQVIDLTQTEYNLLEFFLRNKNSVLTRKRIAEQVWGYTFETGTNIVDVYISYLRKSIDREFSTKLLHTVRGEGFVLRDE